MENIDNNKIEQLEIRIANLKVVIQVAQSEIAELLYEIDKQKEHHVIGFKFNKDMDEQIKPTKTKR